MENGWTERIEELEAALTEERQRTRVSEAVIRENEALTVENLLLDAGKMDLEVENKRLQMMNPCNHTGFESAPCDVCGYPDPRKLIAKLEAENKRLREQYNSLIFEVSYKFPGESRHDTAKRYIREREEHGIEIVAKQALKEASHEG
jgi:hypothetical protein